MELNGELNRELNGELSTFVLDNTTTIKNFYPKHSK